MRLFLGGTVSTWHWGARPNGVTWEIPGLSPTELRGESSQLQRTSAGRDVFAKIHGSVRDSNRSAGLQVCRFFFWGGGKVGSNHKNKSEDEEVFFVCSF